MSQRETSSAHGVKERQCQRRREPGFTLIELLVALTGGLFLSLVVFALARDTNRFYKRETRLANATLASLVGFDRLRADIGRAGFLTTPNITTDPRVCTRPTADPAWPKLLQTLGGIRLIKDADFASDTLEANAVPTMTLLLAGSYVSDDEFPVRTVVDAGSEYQVYLQVNTGPLSRLGYSLGTADSGPPDTQEPTLSAVFLAGRIVRIVDKSGYQHYGVVKSVSTGNNPAVVLAAEPPLSFRASDTATLCGLKGLESGATINVVNIIRYQLGNLRGNDDYEPLYDASTEHFDSDRTELIRSELDPSDPSKVLAGTSPELVAEYAVDLAFGFTAWNATGAADQLSTVTPEGDISEFFPNDTDVIGPVQHVRAIRARLGVRSREADRGENVDLPGLYRIGLGEDGGAPFARVRTLQADIALHNFGRTEW